jgi:predicted RNA-binding Zn-ribbon protein involved in translation (DUF1610 family)
MGGAVMIDETTAMQNTLNGCRVRTTTGGCACPQCGEKAIGPPAPCTCRTLMIYIPPGEHIHVQCPQHGDVKIYGSLVSW